MRRGARAIETLERAGSGSLAWLALLFAWILLRNLLESVLESSHQLGFDWRGEISFGMFFLHFPAFYFALFAALLLWLHVLARRSIGGVARALGIGFGLLEIAPLVDGIASRSGFDLRYLLGLNSILYRFWDPTAALAEVSPGQRVEIVLACVAAGIYVFIARRSRADARLSRSGSAGAAFFGALAATGVFLIPALLGAWPSMFASAATGRPISDAYATVFLQSGLLADESRRHAIVMLLPLLVLVPVALWRADRARFRAVARSLGWTRLLYYSGLAPAGAFVAWLVYRDAAPRAFANPVDIAAVAIIWTAFVAAYLAARFWNDVHDLEADRMNEPARPLPSGSLSVQTAGRAAALAMGGALFLALAVGYHVFLLMIACLVLAWLYSAPPVRLKRWPGLATLTLALLSLTSLAGGYALLAQEMTPLVFPKRLALVVLAGVTLTFTAKDLKDAPGDRETSVHTLATLLGDARARRLSAALLAVAYLSAGVLLPLGAPFYATTVVWAGASAIVVLRRRRPDTLLLGGFLIFALLLLGFLSSRPDLLRDRLPDPLSESHARLLEIEDEIRTARRAEASSLGTLLTFAPAGQANVSARLESLAALSARAPSVRGWDERLGWARAQLAAPLPAIEDLGRLISIRRLSAKYRDRLVAALHAAGRSSDALAAARTAIALGVRPGDFLRQSCALKLAGARPVRAGDERSSREDLRGAFLFGAERGLLWVLLGDELQSESDFAGSADAYREAVRIDPGSVAAWDGLGQALYALRCFDESVAAFDRALALRPRDPWLHNNIGVALRENGSLSNALDHFHVAHQLAPDMYEPAYNLAVTYQALGLSAEAHAWSERAAALRRPAS